MQNQANLLGLSATRIRYLDGQRDMATELFGGRVAAEMTLGEAIARGILPSPRYVISVYRYEEEIRKYAEKVQSISDLCRRSQAKQRLLQLRRALSQAACLPVIFRRYLKADGKYIVFCASVSHLEEIKAQAEEWFGCIDKAYHMYDVYTGNSENKREFQRFQKDCSPHLKLLFCIDMLNEEIHLPDIDGVILLRLTASPVIYRQQIGRALCAGRDQSGRDKQKQNQNSESAKVPLILDLVNNFENLNSIRSVEEEYQEAVETLCLMREKEVGSPGGGFRIVDETREAGKLFAALQEKLETGWEVYYEEAKAYVRARGNLEVPVGYVSPDGLSLGSWLQTQRRVYAGKIPGHLSEEQVKCLEELGIRWESFSDRQWESYYEQAARYYAENGHLNVEKGERTADGFRLDLWLKRQSLSARIWRRRC